MAPESSLLCVQIWQKQKSKFKIKDVLSCYLLFQYTHTYTYSFSSSSVCICESYLSFLQVVIKPERVVLDSCSRLQVIPFSLSLTLFSTTLSLSHHFIFFSQSSSLSTFSPPNSLMFSPTSGLSSFPPLSS